MTGICAIILPTGFREIGGKIMVVKKPAFKLIKTQNAAGHVLCHDITQIIPGVIKDARFRKGHVVTEEDIPVLLSMGKNSLYIWEKTDGMLHEDDAIGRLMALCQNQHMRRTPVKEGKIELFAETDGLFTVDTARLNAVNAIEDIIIATRHGNTAVRAGDVLLGGRVIPLIISEKAIELAEASAGEKPLVTLTPWKLKTAAIVTTGYEVFEGRVADAFTPVVTEKLEKYGVKVTACKVTNDNCDNIKAAILEVKETAPDMILCTGGMSVDPDDRTPDAIRNLCPNIITYGAPVLPGAMFMLGYFEDGSPIMGLPGCVMYQKPTIFDIVLPRVIAGVPLSREDFSAMGNGGLCLRCAECRFPDCAFGKGS